MQNERPERAIRINYGPDRHQFGYLRLPGGEGPHPVIMIVHGGCWTSYLADITSIEPLAEGLRHQGYATWNIEYRCLDHPDGGWPNTILDVGTAWDELRVLAKQYPLDLKRCAGIGHSAGAPLALWLAGRMKLSPPDALFMEEPLPPRMVMAMGGPGDLQAFAKIDVGVCGDSVTHHLLDGSPQQSPGHYAQASPAQLLPLGVPHAVLSGELDPAVPPYLGEEYMKLAKEAGDSVRHIVVKGAGHMDFCAPGTPAWPVILERLKQLK